MILFPSTTRLRNRRPPADICVGCAVVLAGSLVAAACDSNNPRAPDPELRLTFVTPPSESTTSTVIAPPVAVSVTDSSGNVRDGIVSIVVDPNYCGATMSGTLTVEAQHGFAVFPDLAIDLPGDGYTLKAALGASTATSTPFGVASAVVGASLQELATLCLTPNEHRDASSLAYVPQDDAFWVTDDNLPGVHLITRAAGTFLRTIRDEEFESAFPDAVCDDGDGDPATACSYTSEFEVATFDPATDSLYVINTVNDPMRVPPVDKAAIFRLIRQNCASCYAFDAWQALPGGFSYNGAIVINGQLWVADGAVLYAYDFASNAVDTQTLLALPRNVHGLAFDGLNLWAQYNDEVGKYAWPSGVELARHDLSIFSVDDPSGLEVVGGTIYVLEGLSGRNPIRRFIEAPVP